MQVSPQHQCFVYAGAPSNHLGEIARTLLQRRNENRRCLYLNSPTMVAGMRWHLASTGLDLAAAEQRGAIILSTDQSHLAGGKFEIDRMMNLLQNAVQQALADGYEGLWAAGDMTWEFGNEDNLDKLLEYERQLEELMRATPAMAGVCLYHRDTLPDHAIETAFATHPALYVSASLSQLNPRYFERAAKSA